MGKKRKEYIANMLKEGDLSLVNFILKDCNVPIKENISCSIYDYVLGQLDEYTSLQGISSGTEKVRLSTYLHYKEKFIDRLIEKDIWRKDSYKVYLSHLQSNKLQSLVLSNELKKYGISCYLPRVNEILSDEWQNRSESALQTCDSLLVLLKTGMINSYKVNSEIGFSIGKEIPLVQCKLDSSVSYGLLRRVKEIKSNDIKEMAEKYFNYLISNKKTKVKVANSLISMFENSNSFKSARLNMAIVEKNSYWDDDLLKRLEFSIKNNTQIKCSIGVPERIKLLIAREQNKI